MLLFLRNSVRKTSHKTIVVTEERTDLTVIPAKYETRSERVLIEPAREEWKPGSQAINAGAFAGGRVNTATRGQFTVFNGVSNQVVESTETIVNQTGEILCRVLIPAKYKTITKQVIRLSVVSRLSRRQLASVSLTAKRQHVKLLFRQSLTRSHVAL